MAFKQPVIIIGAGIVGLCLAHGLKRANIAFEIYERDENVDSRGQGWAITLHWALPHLRRLLGPDNYKALDTVQVDPAIGKNDTGKFLFINVKTLEPKFSIPPNERRRVGRERMRRLLLEGVREHVRWNKKLADIRPSEDGKTVDAVFEDGSKATGSVLVGAEGSNSSTRRFLVPHAHEANTLPVRFVGVALDMTYEEVKPLRDMDPVLFQGSHPETGVFLWISMLDVPHQRNGESFGLYRVQVNLSWVVMGKQDEVPTENAARVAQIRAKSVGFAPLLKRVIDSIPDEAAVLEIKLLDWPCREWDNHGLVTLVGDAAHAMVMYRGEAANHGILDAAELLTELEDVQHGKKGLKQALDSYEAKMCERTRAAVFYSRQACFDAHNFATLDETSPILTKRAVTHDAKKRKI